MHKPLGVGGNIGAISLALVIGGIISSLLLVGSPVSGQGPGAGGPPGQPLTFVTHDASLTGDGRVASPLRIANSGVGVNHLVDGAVTVAKLAAIPTESGQVLTFDGNALAWRSGPSTGVTGFRYVVAAANLCGTNISTFGVLDHPALNDNPNAVVVAQAINNWSGATNISYSGAGVGNCPLGRWLVLDPAVGSEINVIVAQ